MDEQETSISDVTLGVDKKQIVYFFNERKYIRFFKTIGS